MSQHAVRTAQTVVSRALIRATVPAAFSDRQITSSSTGSIDSVTTTYSHRLVHSGTRDFSTTQSKSDDNRQSSNSKQSRCYRHFFDRTSWTRLKHFLVDGPGFVAISAATIACGHELCRLLQEKWALNEQQNRRINAQDSIQSFCVYRLLRSPSAHETLPILTEPGAPVVLLNEHADAPEIESKESKNGPGVWKDVATDLELPEISSRPPPLSGKSKEQQNTSGVEADGTPECRCSSRSQSNANVQTEEESLHWDDPASRLARSRARFESRLSACESQLYLSIALDLFADRHYGDAVYYLQRAADVSDDPTVLYNLATCYAKGYGVAVSMEKAIRLWRRAGAVGDGRSLYQLGVCQARGLLQDEPSQSTIEYMRQAAQCNVPEAQLYVGAYELASQPNVQTSPSAWLERARRSGDANIQKQLDELFTPKSQTTPKSQPLTNEDHGRLIDCLCCVFANTGKPELHTSDFDQVDDLVALSASPSLRRSVTAPEFQLTATT